SSWGGSCSYGGSSSGGGSSTGAGSPTGPCPPGGAVGDPSRGCGVTDTPSRRRKASGSGRTSQSALMRVPGEGRARQRGGCRAGCGRIVREQDLSRQVARCASDEHGEDHVRDARGGDAEPHCGGG